MAEERKDKRDEGGAPPVSLADGAAGQGFSLVRFEALQQTLGQIGQSAAAGPGAVSMTAGASLAAKIGLAILVSLLGVGASQLALKRDQASRQDPFLPAPGGVDKNGFASANPSAMPPGDPNAGSALTPPTGFSMGSVPAGTDAQMVADAQKQYQKAVAAAKAAMKPGVPQAQHLVGAPSAFKNGLEGTAALQGYGANSTAGVAGGPGNAAGMQAGLAKAMENDRARYAAKLGGHAIGAHAGGRAFRQLTLAEQRSRLGAHSTTGEGSAHSADGAFGSNIGAGSPIGGNGLALGGAGVTNGKPPAGPTASGPSEGQVFHPTPQHSGHKNATPWQKYVDIAKYMLISASGLLALATLFGILANHNPEHPWLRATAVYMAKAAMWLGIMVALIGGVLLGSGQKTQGLIFTLTGVLVAVLAHFAAEGLAQDTGAKAMTERAAEKPLEQSSSQFASHVPATNLFPTAAPVPAEPVTCAADDVVTAAQPSTFWTAGGGLLGAGGAAGGAGGAISSNATGGASAAGGG